MKQRRRRRGWRHVLLLGLVFCAVFYAIWLTSRFAFAFNEQKRVHIFPTNVEATGWNNPQAALTQDLSAQAPAEDFTPQNSATVILAASTSDTLAMSGAAATSTTSSFTEAATSSPTSTVSVGNTAATSTPTPISTPSSEATSTTALSLPAITGNTASSSAQQGSPSFTTTTPLVNPASSSATSTFGVRYESLLSGIERSLARVFAPFVSIAYAATTTASAASSSSSVDPTSTPAIMPSEALMDSNPKTATTSAQTLTADTPTCVIQNIECHTLAFSGFSVGGSVTQQQFQGAELNISFAGLAPESDLQGGRLEARYFHDGLWHSAGDIYLNKEVSNSTNGGYFTVKLDAIQSWGDLSDVKVVIEYVRGDVRAPVNLYLDAVWIDALYKARIQDVLAGQANAPITGAPANVLQTLGNSSADPYLLVEADGTRITYPYLDSVGQDSLVIRSNQQTYQPGANAPGKVYVSVTNTGTQADAFRLYASFPGGGGTIDSIERYVRNVPQATTTEERSDVAYSCDSAWHLASSTSVTSANYVCAPNGEVEACSTLSASSTNCIVHNDVIAVSTSTVYASSWVSLPISISNPTNASVENGLPTGYTIAAASGGTISILPGQTDYLKVSLATSDIGAQRFVLSAAGDAYFGDLDSSQLQLEAQLRADAAIAENQKQSTVDTQISTQDSFTARELPEFKFQYQQQGNVFMQALQSLFGSNAPPKVEQVVLIHKDGRRFAMPATITYGSNGQWNVKFNQRPDPFIPGQYTLLIRIEAGGQVYEDKHTFLWGVLAINTVQAVYSPGDTVNVQMAALSPNGDTVCDANLSLVIVDPSGSQQSLPVTPSGLCKGNNVISVPDYSAVYQAGNPGTYQMLLSRQDSAGVTIAEITDAFEVRDAVALPFVVARTGPTRINPTAPYTMDIAVTARNAFSGMIQESIPNSFAVLNSDGTVSSGSVTWNISMSAGEKKTLRYEFKAPDISPVLYTLGPLTFTSSIKTQVFQEPRPWQIASDAVGNMILLWDGASVPAGWNCVSCVAGNPYYQSFPRGAPSYGVIGGASSHTFSGSGSVSAEIPSAGVTENWTPGGGIIADSGHSHTFTPTFAAESNIPQYRELEYIEYNSAGEPPSIPTGAITVFDASVPAGWTRYSGEDGYYPYGGGTIGATGGNSGNLVSHTVTGTLSAASGATYGTRGGGTQVSAASATHTHSVSTTTPAVDTEPPYLTVILGKLNSAGSPVNGMISMWSGDAPAGWVLESGSTGAFYQRFPKAESAYGTTGGAATSSPADIDNIVTSGPSATANARTGTYGAPGSHYHLVDVTGITPEAILPPYVDTVFAKRHSGVPYYNQAVYRWYANVNAEPPTDPWPVGSTDLAENTPISSSYAVQNGDVVRLRMAVGVTIATSTAGVDAFKLQYATTSSSCGANLNWEDVGAIGSTTAPWRGFDNTSVANGATLSSTTLSVSNVAESYVEQNNSPTVPNDIGIGQYGEWDWVLQQNGALAGTEYCFQMVKSDGSAFDTYTQYPQLVTDQSPGSLALNSPFPNQEATSTTPQFEFNAIDPENETINYEIQISTDSAFGTAIIDTSSASNPTAFSDLITPSDRAPFNSGDVIAYTAATSLANGTTYWWRIRATDPSGSNTWSSWSAGQSFTVDTSAAIDTWFQTTDAQFNTDTLSGVQTTGAGSVDLISGSTTGSLFGSPIDFSWGKIGNAWGSFSWTDVHTTGSILYHVEYLTSTSSWALIPDSDLAGNSTGFSSSPVNLLGLSPTTYSTIRLEADLTNSGGSPILDDWTVQWGYQVAQPTLLALFDNEKTGTTTPTFKFSTTDPQSNTLVYQIEWSTDPTFATGVSSSTSDVSAGFSNLTTPTNTSPFISGNTIQFSMQPPDALTNGATYWWRVRARAPSGGNAYSDWSSSRSFTVDTSVSVSTWFQTTNAQFDTDSLFGLYSVGDSMQVATSVADVMLAYGEGTNQSPQYRVWNGSTWSSQQSAFSVGAAINWVVTRAHPSADEYALATMGTNGNIYAQVYQNGAWGNEQLLTSTVSATNMRGFDIAYEQQSGRLIAVYCNGTSNPSYRIFDGSSWSSAVGISVTSTVNCGWIRLASKPGSNEITLVEEPTDGSSYQALVWNGSSWGNSSGTFGSMSTPPDEGMAVQYEASGNAAIAAVSNGHNNMAWNSWNGTAWAGATSQNIGGYLWANLRRNVATDEMGLCYINGSGAAVVLRWTGTAWAGQTTMAAAAESSADRPIDCAYETNSGRANDLMAIYSDATGARYQYWNGTAWSGQASVSTIPQSATVQAARDGHGAILGLFFDVLNDSYDFSSWNGSSWSAYQTLESSASVTSSPYKEPFMMAPRNSVTSGYVYSTPIVFTDGLGPKWSSISWNNSQTGGSTITYHVQYYTSTSSWALVPDSALPNNSTGTTTGPIDISPLSPATYGTIRLLADFACSGATCPTLSDWTTTWSAGITISGTAQQFDRLTNVTSGTVAVAVNGVLQTGKTGTISAGVWSIPNVTAFAGDTVTVFVQGAVTAANRAVTITKYSGTGDITGLPLYEDHLTLDSSQGISNGDIGKYDNSVSGSSDIFDNVDASNNLFVCASGVSGCADARLLVTNGTVYEPSGSSAGNVTTPDIEIDGTLIADGNTISVNRSWRNEGAFISGTSSVIFDATSTIETIDNSGATSTAFYAVTFGEGSGSAVWNLASPLYASSTLAISYGTLAPGATSTLTLDGNLSIGVNGLFTKSAATTTFEGASNATWTDNSAAKQDMGTVVITGGSKTVLLGSSVRATDITVGSSDTLDAVGSNTVYVGGNWTNSGLFFARSGTVDFTATTTGHTIVTNSNSFYNLTFNGPGGNWAFYESNVTISGDLTISSGTLTLPTGTTTIAGNFSASGGSFMHNNGTVALTASAAKSVAAGGSPFYNLTFSGSGSWAWGDTNATSSNNVIISSGTVTMPSGTLAIGGSLANSGGSISGNNGTLRFFALSGQSVKLGGGSASNLTFDGIGGSWNFLDTNATTTGSLNIVNGSVSLPSGVFAVGGSLTDLGTFAAGSGTVSFDGSGAGNTVNPGSSAFYNLSFNGTGAWTVIGNATSTNSTALEDVGSLTVAPGDTLEVDGAFTNAVANASTTWSGSTLYLNSGTNYTINSKTNGGDTYGAILLGTNTQVRMWNASAAAVTAHSGASLYSQNNAGVDGALYIYGAFSSGRSESWSYATDFDGAALSSANARQVTVAFAPGASATLSGPFAILGTTTASTTITNQGSGTYGLSVTGGTLNAQYYSITNTDASGLAISGTTSIASLGSGDFTLSTNGGSSITVASTVIDQNPALQMQDNGFATSTGITSGYNVTEVGTPTSYWWFRNGYGNYYGENFDNDPGGNPGYIRWDDSGFNITVSGHIYSDHGITPIGSPTCDGTTQDVVVAAGTSTYATSCSASTGAYSISNVQFVGDVVLTAYLNTNGGARAATITRTPTADITNFDLYQNSVIMREENTSPLTNANLAAFDSSQDSDIPFTVSGSTLTLASNTELYVWSGKTFAPGGNVVLEGAGSGAATDGRLFLASNSTFTESGTETLAIGGGLTVSSGATFAAASSALTFTATSTGKSIFSAQPLSLHDITFNGAGGGWSLDSGSGIATTTVHSLTLTAGTVSGSGDMVVQTGGATGAGAFAMTGGTIELDGTGVFGGSTPWQFANLTLGNGVNGATTTASGSATTTVSSILDIALGAVLQAGAAPWVVSGGGTPLLIQGTLSPQTAPFWYTATAATFVANADYAALYLEPSGAGSPTYTLSGGTPTIGSITVGDGTHAVVATANTNDPSIGLTGSLVINANATFTASNVGSLDVGGSWINDGVFTASGGSVLFNSAVTGNTVFAGASPFYDVAFNSSSGGWTISGDATSTHDFTLTSASSFTLTSGSTLEVDGTFTNSAGGAATVWTGSSLYLNSGTGYALNAKTNNGDTYGTLAVGSATQIRMWNSSAATTSVNASGSLYSMNHAGVRGDLYIWGAYTRSSGADYWSYSTDFDGTDISTSSPRQVNVYVASSSNLMFSGGFLDIIGDPTASTTIQNQGSGSYGFSVSGGTLDAQYYKIRNTDANGLDITGTTAVSELGNGDFELDTNGGTMMTVAGSVITANPLKVFWYDSFATTTGITAGYNVTATGSAASSWKFHLSYGNYQGEAYDNDPLGDPGYIVWDNSAAQITISGHVYSDEGTTVSSVCDGTTTVVRFVLEGTVYANVPCAASDGLFTIPNVSYNPGDKMIAYLNTGGGTKGATVSVDPASSISDFDIYEHRVIVRHESASPLTIADMAEYDASKDSNIPFTAATGTPDTLTVPPNTKLIVWNNKTFAPAGNVTLESGGSGTSYDGTLEVRNGGTFSESGTQTLSVGGDFLVDSGASFSPANSSVFFTATTTGHTITPADSSFYNVTFSGAGGNWAFGQASATSSNNFTISAGTVTLPTGMLNVGGSFENTGGTFMHNNGTLLLTSAVSGNSIETGGSNLYTLIASSTSGSWSFVDTSATSSGNVLINAGALTLPPGSFTIGGSFINGGGSFNASGGTLEFDSSASGNSIEAGGSSFANLTFDGSAGAWTFLDQNATTTGSVSILAGSTTLPAATFAIGGSFTNAGTFTAGTSTVSFVATSTGKTVDPGASAFYDLLFDSATGGWTISADATSTASTTIAAASNFTLASGASLAVGGTFTNLVGGSAATWTGSTLYLHSGMSYTVNTKLATGDTYGSIDIASSTQVRLWNSSAANVSALGSLYSMNDAGVSGSLYIYGAYSRTSGSDYWDYATDFDGTALGGASRQVSVRIATSSSLSFASSTLQMVGSATATTTVASMGTGTYPLSIADGTLNAQFYQIRDTDTNGLDLSGSPIVTSLSNGDFKLGVNGGAMISLTGSVVDANPSETFSNDSFATSSGIASGYNVSLSGTPNSFWTFTQASGNYAGEAYDNDGATACGSIRWDNSSCLLVSEAHYRWRNDDGGEGALTSEWYNTSWSYREQIAVSNANAAAYTDIPVQIEVPYLSGMNSNFSDLRFTDASGTTSIPYWIESYTSGGTSTVWVQVPSIPASSASDIYLYYGNSSATDASNAASTFSFFESFESGSLSSYSGDTSLFNIGTTFAYNGTYGLDAGANTTQKTTNGIYRTGSYTAHGDTIEYHQYVDSTQQDEPCTLFGVGGSGSNYAVCLEEYPSQYVSIAKNVTSDDRSGTVLASSTVSYATGWYQVDVDWLSSGAIDVTVYDASGNVFATVSANDTSHSSGGMGFSYWGQHGGWDLYTVRPYTPTPPTYVFGSPQQDGGATWAAAQDTPLGVVSPLQNLRLRFSVQNTGANQTGQQYRLQAADMGSALNCESVPYTSYNDVPTTTGGCGTAVACMTSSSNFTNQSYTSPLLSFPASMGFTPGRIMQDPSNQTNSMSLPTNSATEVEYNFQMTSYATGNAYCFRTTNGGLDLDAYNHIAEIQIIHPPVISNIALNNAQDIALTEGTTTTVSASCTVSDSNGYADIVQATSTIYRSGVGSDCASNYNNCYQIATSSCTFSSCSGTSCTLTCSAPIEYFAEPTDASSTYSGQSWLATIAIQNSAGLRDTQTSLGVNLLTLYGLSIATGPIDFGSLQVGQNTGATNATTTIVNTGNSPINVQLSGTDLSSGANTIPVGEQKYATSTFVYGSCSICQFLTGSASNVSTNIAKPTSTTTQESSNLYFGVNVPNGSAAASYNGTNTFIAVGG